MGRTSLFAGAAVVLVIGFIALGSLSPSGPAAIETTSTTSSPSTTIAEIEPPVDPEDFTVAQIATGEPLEWEAVQTSVSDHPMEIVDRRGRLYLFTTSAPWWTGEPGGMSVWQSSDGQSWTSTREVIPDHFRVTAVAPGPRGFVAAGATPGGQSLIVWRSDDGITWTATEIPTEARKPYQTPTATAVAATGNRIVVAAEIEIDRESIVEDHLAEIGIDVDLSEAGWATRYAGDGGLELSVYGPLVTPAVTIKVDELDLTEQERRWLTSSPEPTGQTSIWVIDDKGNLDSSTIPLTRVTEIVGRSTGGLLALGQRGAAAPAGFTSSDGMQWNPIADRPTPLGAVNRESFLVGFADVLRPDLLYSMLGGTWMEMGVDEVLPPSAASWSAVAFGGGDHGVALAIEGRVDTAGFSESVQARHHALVLNTGALDWDIKDLAPVVGIGQVVRLVAVGSDRVVVILDEAVFADENPPGFEIWSAPTP